MRWTVFMLATYVAFALDVSISSDLQIGGIHPSFVAALATFIALNAPRMSALWACWILGLLYDLIVTQIPYGLHTHETIVPIGPHALGFVFACFGVLQLRTMVFRRRALTIGVTTLFFFLAVQLVAVAVFTMRSWYMEEQLLWKSAQTPALVELFRRLLIAVFSGLIAVPLGWMLIRSLPIWGMPLQGSRPGEWR